MFDNLERSEQYYIHLIVSALMEIRIGGSDRMSLRKLRVNSSGMQYKAAGLSEGHLLGLAICLLERLDNIYDLVEATGRVAYCFQDKKVTDMFRNCDKSNYGLLRFIRYLREKI